MSSEIFKLTFTCELLCDLLFFLNVNFKDSLSYSTYLSIPILMSWVTDNRRLPTTTLQLVRTKQLANIPH